jgi:hypothetical protein
MLWIGVFAYLLALCTLGILSLAKGHWVLFILGLVLPPFWLVGAVLAPTAAARKPAPAGPPAGLDAGTGTGLESGPMGGV